MNWRPASVASCTAIPIALSRASYRKMTENLVWATGYNVVAIPVAAGLLVPWGIDLTIRA